MFNKRSNTGFTIVELLVVLAVASIVLSLIYQVYRAQLKSHTTQQELVGMQQNLRAVLYLMEREIRMAGHAPNGGVPDPAISIARIDSIAFAMDLTEYAPEDTSTGDVAQPGEQISYFLDPDTGELIRNAGSGNQTLLRSGDIDLVTFVYKDSDGHTLDDDGNGNLTAADSLRAIRTVEVVLDASIGATPMVSPHQMQLRSEVKCRNLGL